MDPRVTTHLMLPEHVEQALGWADDERFRIAAGWLSSSASDRRRRWLGQLDDPHSSLIRIAATVDDDLIGYADLAGAGPHERELGFAVGPSSRWGRGFGAWVATAGITYGFEVLRLRSIWAQAAPTNERSLRTLRSVGLVPVDAPDAVWLKADPDNLIFRITREAWTDRPRRDQSERR